ERERARRREDRLPAVQARIARPCDRSPAAVASIDEEDVIELVHGLEAQDERRIAVLFEDDGREERRFETVRAARADDAAEAAQCRAAVRLLVVGEAIEVALDEPRRPKPRDQPPLVGSK